MSFVCRLHYFVDFHTAGHLPHINWDPVPEWSTSSRFSFTCRWEWGISNCRQWLQIQRWLFKTVEWFSVLMFVLVTTCRWSWSELLTVSKHRWWQSTPPPFLSYLSRQTTEKGNLLLLQHCIILVCCSGVCNINDYIQAWLMLVYKFMGLWIT